MIKINCDIGERGPDHPIDIALMQHIQIANIACGGHAGDRESVAAFLRLAETSGVIVAAHPSYPDRENFGRKSLDIPSDKLLESLDEQITLLPGIDCVKFHGALYNDAVVTPQLAEILTQWLVNHDMKTVITSATGELARSCQNAGLTVSSEAFAERHYAFDPERRQLTLVSRAKDYASIRACDEALAHSRSMVYDGVVNAFIEDDAGTITRKSVPIGVDTICIHSDSVIALELATQLNSMLKQG